MTDYHGLAVYQRAYAVSLRIHRSLAGRNDDVAGQLRRASKSIPANIAEGCSKANTIAETRRFLAIALRSVDEVKVWLDYCRDLSLLSVEEIREIDAEYREIGAMLYTLWLRWESTHRR